MPRLLFIAFIESFATVLLERGFYFYTHERLHFSESANLWVAFAFGLAYALGALVSHRFALKLGEKCTLLLTMIAVLALHTVMALRPTATLLVVTFPLVALVTGMKWPIIESYISAGQTPRSALRAVGRFNVSWSLAVPLAMGASGPLIGAASPSLLFAVAAAINVATLFCLRPLAAAPLHLPHDHPERLPQATVMRYRALLVSSRWSLLSSFALLFVMAPLMPQIFADLGLTVTQATNGAALLDVVRVVAFVVLGYAAAWHGRVSPLAAVLVGLPVGFFAVLFGGSVPVVLVGEVIFGGAAGLAYYAALYYAMVVSNASVDAGGAHEGLIGGGFALGPLVGLTGLGLADALGGELWGMLAGVGPMLLLFTAAALWPLLRTPSAEPVGGVATSAP